MASDAASSLTGETWSIDGNKLVLSSALGAGYTLKSTKTNTYALENSTGSAAKEIVSINGLDLTNAKDAKNKISATGQSNVEATEGWSEKTDAEKAAAYLNKYIEENISVSGNTIQIGKDLLGTSNITITNSGDTTYKLAAGKTGDTGVYTSKTAAEEAVSPEWTFSGGTATYKQTTPEYYVANAAGTQLTYNRPVAGTTLATVRGLLNTKTEYGGEGDSAYTDTTKVGVYTIDGKDVIGAQVTRKNKAGTETVQSTTQGLELVDGETPTTYNIKVNNAVLGTSNVTFTGSTNYKALTLNAAAPQVSMDSYAWTGSVNGTSAVLKGNYTKGYALNTAGTQITYTAARNNVNLATITGIKINIDSDTTKATINSEEKTLKNIFDAKVAALGDNPTTAQTNAARTEATNEFIDAWLKTKLTGVAETAIKTNDKSTLMTFTIDEDLLNKANVIIRSNDQRKYAIALDTGAAAPATAVVETFKWNGFNYQKYNEGFYTETTNESITYTRPTSAVTLATVRGLKSGVNLNNLAKTFSTGASAFASAEGGGGTLTVSTDLLNNAKVSVATTTALTGTFTIALDTAAVNTNPDATYETAWTVNGTTATKTSGAKQAYYTHEETKNEINYTAATQVKTLATLRGLKSGAVADTDFTDDNNGKITLKKSALGTTNITLAKGTGDALTYELKLDNAIKPSSILKGETAFTEAKRAGTFGGVEYNASLEPAWATQGVNTTLKGSVSDGWAISSNGLTAQHTASATNKALATFAFDKAGITAGDASSALNGNTITLGSLGENKRLTVRTNPDALKLKFTDFNGTAAAGETAAVNTSVIGSASADSFEFDHATALNNIVVSGAADNASIFGDAGDDRIYFTSGTGSKINAGIGNDTISIAGGTNLSVLGDAGNDFIIFNDGSGTIHAGLGNDAVTLGGSANVTYYYEGGNDSIKGYSDDTLKLKAGLTIKTASVSGGNDLILTIGGNRITLVDAYTSGTSDFSYYVGTDTTASKVTIAGATASSSDLHIDTAGLLADNNLMTPGDISDLISTNSVTEYHVGNYNLTTPDQILPESDNISYGNQKKKNNK